MRHRSGDPGEDPAQGPRGYQLWRFLLQLPLAWDLDKSEEEKEGSEAVSAALHLKLRWRQVCGTLPATIRVLLPRLAT